MKPLSFHIHDLPKLLKGSEQPEGARVRGAAYIFRRDPLSIGSLLSGRVEVCPGLDANPLEMPRLEMSNVTSAKALYRPGEAIHLLVFDPYHPGKDAVLHLHLQGRRLDRHVVRLSQQGCAHLVLDGLEPGAYRVSLESGAKVGPSCAFGVAVYRMAPLTASIRDKRLKDQHLTLTLDVAQYGRPVDADEAVVSLKEGTFLWDRQKVAVQEGVARLNFKLQGVGPFSLDFQLASEPSHTATMPIRGSRESERRATALARLGARVRASLIPSGEEDREVRGLYIQEGEASKNAPFELERVDASSARIKALKAARCVVVTRLDPVTGQVSQELRRDTIGVGETIELLAQGPACAIVVGAFVEGTSPWEGWAMMVTPSSSMDAARIEIPPEPAPGDEILVDIDAGLPVQGDAYLIVKDARLEQIDTPAGLCAAAIKDFAEVLDEALTTGPAVELASDPKTTRLREIHARLMAFMNSSLEAIPDTELPAVALRAVLRDHSKLQTDARALWSLIPVLASRSGGSAFDTFERMERQIAKIEFGVSAPTALNKASIAWLSELKARFELREASLAKIAADILGAIECDEVALMEDMVTVRALQKDLQLAAMLASRHTLPSEVTASLDSLNDAARVRALRLSFGEKEPERWILRVSKLLKANVNDLIRRASDPEKILNQLILDLREQLIEGKRRAVLEIQEEKALKKSLEDAVSLARSWENKAATAVRAQRDDLAREALDHKAEHDRCAEKLQAQWEKQKTTSNVYRDILRALNSKIEEAKRKKNVLIARQRRASAMRHINETMHGLSETSAFDAFERLESRSKAAREEAAAGPVPSEGERQVETRASDKKPPQVVFAGLLTLEKGRASARVRLGGRSASYLADVFIVSEGEWEHRQVRFRAQSDPFVSLELPAFLDPRDTARGRLVARASSGRMRLSLACDGVPVALEDSGLLEGDAVVDEEDFEAAFEVGLGHYEATVEDVETGRSRSFSQRVEVLGKPVQTVRSLRFLAPGEVFRAENDPEIAEVRVLDDFTGSLDRLVQATANYRFLCCEQTAAKVLSAAAMHGLSTDPLRRQKAADILVAGVRREESMWLEGRGFKGYPDSADVSNDYYGRKTTRYLLRLAPLTRASDPRVAAAARKALEMARDAARAYGLKSPPEVLETCEDAYLVLKSAERDRHPEALTWLRQHLSTQSDLGQGRVQKRMAQCYAAAGLLLGGEAEDEEMALRLAGKVFEALRASGRLYSTLDSMAAIAFMQAMLDRFRPVGGTQTASGWTIVEVTRVGQAYDWAFLSPTVRLEVVLHAQGNPTDTFVPGETAWLELALESGYRFGDLVWLCLPDALSHLEGGGQVKLFAVDLRGRRRLRLPLAVTNLTGFRGEATRQHFRIWLRNMYEEERFGDAGDLSVCVLPRGDLPERAQPVSVDLGERAPRAFDRPEAQVLGADDALAALRAKMGLPARGAWDKEEF